MKKDLQLQIKYLGIAVKVLTIGFSVLAISIILLVYGNPSLVSTQVEENKINCSSEIDSNCKIYVPQK